MASQQIEFMVEYAEPCPDCFNANPSRLSALGLVEGRGIVCAAGAHSFEQLPSEKTAVQTQAERPAAEYKNRPSESDLGPAPAGEAQEPAKEQVTPLDSQPATSATASATSEGGESGKPLSGDFPEGLSRVVDGLNKLAGGAVVDLRLWHPVPCGGGDVVVLVQLSEKHYQALASEAGAQAIPFADYFADWIRRADEQGWN